MENHDRCSIPHFRTFQRGFVGGKIEVREGFITLQRRKSGIRVGAARSSAQKEATGPSDRMPRWGKEKERHVAIHRTQGPFNVYTGATKMHRHFAGAERDKRGERETQHQETEAGSSSCGVWHQSYVLPFVRVPRSEKPPRPSLCRSHAPLMVVGRRARAPRRDTRRKRRGGAHHRPIRRWVRKVGWRWWCCWCWCWCCCCCGVRGRRSHPVGEEALPVAAGHALGRVHRRQRQVHRRRAARPHLCRGVPAERDEVRDEGTILRRLQASSIAH
jgi:hypothetical protein